jgi:hypothetical protein
VNEKSEKKQNSVEPVVLGKSETKRIVGVSVKRKKTAVLVLLALIGAEALLAVRTRVVSVVEIAVVVEALVNGK